MAKSIALVDIKIREMVITPEAGNITVKYVILDEGGEVFRREQVETYWVTLPDPAESNSVQLPANYVSLITSLYTAALAALKAKYL